MTAHSTPPQYPYPLSIRSPRLDGPISGWTPDGSFHGPLASAAAAAAAGGVSVEVFSGYTLQAASYTEQGAIAALVAAARGDWAYCVSSDALLYELLGLGYAKSMPDTIEDHLRTGGGLVGR